MISLSSIKVGNFFTKDEWIDRRSGILPGPHPHGVGQTLLWVAGIIISSVVYFLLYFAPGTLHDSGHYATAGVSLIRDHKDLLYPYFPDSADGLGPAYKYFQNHTITFDVRTNYPAKLYTAIYGMICQVTGQMRLEYLQWMSCLSFIAGNIFLYLTGSRFFRGPDLLLFMIAVIFLPLMRETVGLGTDGIGITASLALLWLCLGMRVNPLVLGLYAGIFAHFRGQMLSVLLVFPFLYTALSDRRFFRGALLPMVIGFAITYTAMALLFDAMIYSLKSSDPVGFYMQHFKNCLTVHFGVALKKWLSSFAALFDKSQLFVYAVLAIPSALQRGVSLQKNLAIAAILYVALPMFLYAFDQYAPVQPRYYMFAAPLLILSIFMTIKTAAVNTSFVIPARGIFLILTTIILSAWYVNYGFPFELLKAKSIASRAQFLDFDGVQEAMTANFKDNDIVIINHSLPTALSRLHNVIYVPPFKEFQAGDNSEIKGIVFVFSDTAPNDFFKPKDWLQGNDALPVTLADSSGLKFKQVYAKTSDVLNSKGGISERVYFYIYINAGRS